MTVQAMYVVRYTAAGPYKVQNRQEKTVPSLDVFRGARDTYTALIGR